MAEGQGAGEGQRSQEGAGRVVEGEAVGEQRPRIMVM